MPDIQANTPSRQNPETKQSVWPSGSPATPTSAIPPSEQVVTLARYVAYIARIVLGLVRKETLTLCEAISQVRAWCEGDVATAGCELDPDTGIEQLLQLLAEDIENGHVPAKGWDKDLSGEWLQHPAVQRMLQRLAPERWTMEKARTWFMDQIEQRPVEDIEWTHGCVARLIQNLAQDREFREKDLRELIPWLKKMAGKELELGLRDLTAVFRDARKAREDRPVENHVDVARRLLDYVERGGELRYDKEQFWQWNGSRFEHVDYAHLYQLVATVTDNPLVMRHFDYEGIIEVLENMCSRTIDPTPGINFANGFLGRHLVLNKHSPSFGATWTLPFDFDPGRATACLRWLDFLHSCWGTEPDYDERVLALQEMFAATFFGIAPSYQRAFLLYGQSGAGKSQILNVLRALMPPNAVGSVEPDQWASRFALTGLVGTDVNICGELPEQGRIAGHLFKQIVEGAPISTEFKGKDRFSFNPTCAQWFASNLLPTSSDSSKGFLRRWLILDFNHAVKDDEKIIGLAELIVAEERDAIAAWAVAGLDRLLRQGGYTLPACHHRRVHQMSRHVNPVLAFLDDARFLTRGQELRMRAHDLYDDYRFYSNKVGRRPVNWHRFVAMLEDLGHRVQRHHREEWVMGLARTPDLRS